MTVNIVLTVVGALVLVVGLFSEPLKRSYLSVTLVGLLVGVLLSPAVFGVLDPGKWGSQATILEEASRLTLAIVIMGITLRIPRGYPLSRWRSLAVVLGPVMALMWVTSSLLAYWILGLPFWVAMLIGAVVTPTDPVLASSIVQGQVATQNLPSRVRHLLSTESGANDGLAYLFVFLPILMLLHPPGDAVREWFTFVLPWQILGGMVIGALIGYGAGRLLEYAQSRGTIRESPYLIYAAALAIFVLGLTRLINTDGIFAVFAAGVAFSLTISSDTKSDQESTQEAVDRFFVLPIFALLGLALPWSDWIALGWKAPVLAGAVLLLRRIPAILAMSPLLFRTGGLKGLRESFFYGWFGPIGVAALYYATLAEHRTGIHEVYVVGSLIISASVLVHGVSAAPFTRLFGRRVETASEESEEQDRTTMGQH